jgi:hypothetical protein
LNSIEKSEILEIRQVFEDYSVRLDRAFTDDPSNSELAQCIKVAVHIKKRLKRFSEGRIRQMVRYKKEL